jgi:cytochrome c peroxidase
MNKIYGYFSVFIIILSFLNFNTKDNELKLTRKDVQLVIPKGFPPPHYDFKKNPIAIEGFLLGRKLFYDGILSRDSSVSCHTCHQRIAAFAHIDHTLSHGIDAQIGARNVPALQNLIWRDAFMWDGGINHLEIQAINPITSKIEMDESLENVLMKLRRNREYRKMFKSAFKDTLINSERMLKALTQFTGLMISNNSRYDMFMRGEDSFTSQEKNGLKLFRQKCASCHKEPLFTDNSYRHNGLFIDSNLNDLGRGKITGQKEDNYKFKVPSLRNVEMTYPYMHDGRFRKLYEVVKHYGNPDAHSTIVDEDIKKIGKLNDNEKVDLVAFLLTLTDKKFLYDKRFSDPSFR